MSGESVAGSPGQSATNPVQAGIFHHHRAAQPVPANRAWRESNQTVLRRVSKPAFHQIPSPRCCCNPVSTSGM